MDIQMNEFRLLDNGEVEQILRDAEFDQSTGVYTLLGSIQLSDKTFMSGAMFLDEDLNKVWDAVPYQDENGNIESRKLDDPIILSITDTPLVAKARFKQYLDDKINAYNDLIQNLGQIDPQFYQDFLKGDFNTVQNHSETPEETPNDTDGATDATDANDGSTTPSDGKNDEP